MVMARKPQKQVYSPKEVAQALDCHIRTIYRAIEDGVLPAEQVRRGGEYRISRNTLRRAYPSVFYENDDQ